MGLAGLLRQLQSGGAAAALDHLARTDVADAHRFSSKSRICRQSSARADGWIDQRQMSAPPAR